MACAEDGLLPAIRAADDGTLVVADGFSCRTQVEQSGVLTGGRRPAHLAQILATALRSSPPGDHANRVDHANGGGHTVTTGGN